MLSALWLQLLRTYWQVARSKNIGEESENYWNRLLQTWQSCGWSSRRLAREQEFLVLDAEMSSLDVDEGELLSLGWVVIRQGRIELSTAEHLLLKPRGSVGDSAVIHQLRDCELEQGVAPSEILARLLQAAEGRVLVFHHALIDLSFINHLCRGLTGAPLLLPCIDTLEIEKQRLLRREQPLSDGVLKLASCCARYNLPSSPAHNALTDALATAELLLAQIAHKGEDTRLGDLR